MIVTYTELLKFLDLIPEDQEELDEALLNEYNQAAQNIVEKYCNRKFEKSTFTEYKSGQRYPTIQVLNFPIDSGADVKVYIRTDIQEGFVELDNTTYIVDHISGMINYPPCFPENFKNVQVDYTGGFVDADIPSNIKLAIKTVAKILYEKREQNALGLKDYHSGDAVIKYDESLVPIDVKVILSSYKNWSFR